MSNFIPSFHLVHPSEKMTASWCKQAVHACYFNTGNRTLLQGKDITEIESYSDGSFSMTPFKRMFKSLQKAMAVAPKDVTGGIDTQWMTLNDTTGIDWTPLALIPVKINSAVSVVQKIPVEVTCKALDALAVKKKDEDILFLKNKPKIEAELQDLADQMQIGPVDLGTTKHSSDKYSDSPMGFDLNEPDEADVFMRLFYSLEVETAFEKALQQFYDLKKAELVKLLEIRDHFKWGVSVNRGYNSSLTGLPMVEYIYPDDISTPPSRLPDYSDNTHRIFHDQLTVMELYNHFSDEIGSMEDLERLVNGDRGYCKCNNSSTISSSDFGSKKIVMKYLEVKTVDWVGVGVRSDTGARYITTNEEEAQEKIWGQNTYGFWWLINTEYYFGIHQLPYAHRTKGQESFQNFSTNIYKSQPRSAVELSIGENKKAQFAEIKLQHLIIKSLPPGKYIDLRYVRGALSGLKDEANSYTLTALVNLAFEQNIIIGDTEGFDGKNDGQMKPFMDIIGGLKLQEAQGYLTIIAAASQNISNFTGINEQLTGQSANPEGLVGMQKLLINSSLNALYYCNEAIRIQYQNLFNLWANLIQQSVEAGGKIKKAIIDMIGAADTKIIDGLNQLPLHRLSVKVEISQREQERQEYLNQLNFLKTQGVINTTDEYLLSGVQNPKQRMALLAIKEKKFKKEQQKIRTENFAQQQQVVQQQGQNLVQAQQARTSGKIEEVYAKGDTQAKLAQLSNQLGLSERQLDAIIAKALQQDRNAGQTDKNIKTIQEKKRLEDQAPLV